MFTPPQQTWTSWPVHHRFVVSFPIQFSFLFFSFFFFSFSPVTLTCQVTFSLWRHRSLTRLAHRVRQSFPPSPPSLLPSSLTANLFHFVFDSMWVDRLGVAMTSQERVRCGWRHRTTGRIGANWRWNWQWMGRPVIHRLIYPFLSFFHFFSSFFFVFKDSNQNIQKIKMNQIKFVLVFVWEAGVTSSPILDEGQGVFSSLSSGKWIASPRSMIRGLRPICSSKIRPPLQQHSKTSNLNE